MTYGELKARKTFGFVTNHVIDDIVSNAQWAWPRKEWQSQQVSDHELESVRNWAAKEGVSF